MTAASCGWGVFALVAATVLGGTVMAQEAEGPRVLRLQALNVGEAFFFKVPGKGTENPELGFLAGQEVEVRLEGKGHVAHSLRFGAPIGAETAPVAPGARAALGFVVPTDADGTSSYWCTLHRDRGMEGPVVFGVERAGPRLELPAAGLLLAGVAVAVSLWLHAGGRKA